MKTFHIKNLENGAILTSVQADNFTVDENGIVVFQTSGSKVGVTQLSPSTIIIAETTISPVLVMPKKV